MTNIMFFNPGITGHNVEYITHILKYGVERHGKANYYFVLNPDFVRKFGHIQALSDDKPSFKLIEMAPADFDRMFSQKNLIKKSIIQFRVMNSYAKKFDIDHVVLLHLNPFQFSLGWHKTRYTVSGILFSQFTWQAFSSDLKGWLHKKRKQFQTYWMLRNKKVKTIFVLNDAESCYELNKTYKTNVFRYLPDPVADFQCDAGFNLRSAYHIPPNHKIFLHIGTIVARKGVLEIIEAIKYLDGKVLDNIHIMIIGATDAAFDELIRCKLEEISAQHKCSIIYENKRISDAYFKSIFEQSDFILMPYKNMEASSGILGHAIVNRKQVIGPKQGLLGHLIAKNKLGYLLDETDGLSIAEAITDCFNQQAAPYDETMRSEYVQTHTSDEFAKIILDQI